MDEKEKKLLEKKWGMPIRAWWDVLAREHPEMINAYDKYRTTIYEKKALSPKVKELIIIGVDAALFWPGIKVHLKRALDIGVTKEEIIEALELATLPGSFHALVFGLMILDELLEAEKTGKLSEYLSK